MTMGGADVTRMVENTATRWEYQTKRDERLFHAAWFADFKERWKHDLYTERLNFQARMDAL